LTEAGQTYLQRVRMILQDIEEADTVTSAQAEEMAGLLRLHAPPVLATHVIGPLLAGFRELYPRIQIDIEVDFFNTLSVEAYDITLIGAGSDFDANIVARKVMESETVLVAAPAYLQRRGHPQRPEDLTRHDCLRDRVVAGHARTWRMWREDVADSAVDIDVAPVMQSNHTDSILRATLDGMGITSVPMDLVAAYLNSGELVRVLAPWITGRPTLYAALPSRKFIPQRTRVFLDYLVERTREGITRARKATTKPVP
jgi:DNA-binding transcriptional LysR family regulator